MVVLMHIEILQMNYEQDTVRYSETRVTVQLNYFDFEVKFL